MAIVVLRSFWLGRQITCPTVDLDLAPERLRRALDLRDLLDVALERGAEPAVARRTHRSCAMRRPARLGGAGIHQIGRAAERLGIGAHALEPQEVPVEIERVRLRPRLLDGIEPFLGEVVARVVLALGDAEHFELALVPADHQIDAEATFADMIGGDELLGGDQRMEQGTCTVPNTVMRWVTESRPTAQVTVSSVLPWKSVSPP